MRSSVGRSAASLLPRSSFTRSYFGLKVRHVAVQAARRKLKREAVAEALRVQQRRISRYIARAAIVSRHGDGAQHFVRVQHKDATVGDAHFAALRHYLRACLEADGACDAMLGRARAAHDQRAAVFDQYLRALRSLERDVHTHPFPGRSVASRSTITWSAAEANAVRITRVAPTSNCVRAIAVGQCSSRR